MKIFFKKPLFSYIESNYSFHSQIQGQWLFKVFLIYWGSQTNLILISSGPKVFEFYFYHNPLVFIHTYIHTILFFCHLLYLSLQISTYWLLLNHDFGYLGSSAQNPVPWLQFECFVCITATCLMRSFCRCLLIRNRFLAVFSNLRSCSIPLFWDHVMLIQFCLASCFHFLWLISPSDLQKSGSGGWPILTPSLETPVRTSTAQERDKI